MPDDDLEAKVNENNFDKNIDEGLLGNPEGYVGKFLRSKYMTAFSGIWKGSAAYFTTSVLVGYTTLVSLGWAAAVGTAGVAQKMMGDYLYENKYYSSAIKGAKSALDNVMTLFTGSYEALVKEPLENIQKAMGNYARKPST
jgi:hypothetical protein